MMEDRTESIDLYASEAFSHGGIQTYMRSIIRAVSETGCLRRVVSLQDAADDGEAREWMAEHGFEYAGASGSKARFVGHCLLGSKPPKYVVVGYVTLAPVALLQKKLGLIDGYIVILHGIEAWESLRPWEEWALQEADAVVCTTQFTAEKTVQLHGVDPEQIDILPLAVEPARFDGDPEDGCSVEDSTEKLNLLTVSRLNPEHSYKGVDYTLKAISVLLEKGIASDGILYHVIGDGADRKRLESLADELGLQSQVNFLGYVSDERLDQAFNEADVFVMPSSGEGFGLVYVEAMCFGVPCIASPEGGAQYVVRDEETGLMAQAGEPESIADAIERMFDDELRARLGDQALDEARTRFAYPRFRRDFGQILRCRFSPTLVS
jgi:glycosyltransferase involved in cell wall biosynthesis